MERNDLSRSVGWQVWNMSKRVSSAARLARDARTHLERARASGRWAPDYLATLERLTERFEAIAAHAEDVWGQLRSLGEPRSLAQVEAIWHDAHVADYFEVQEAFAAAAAAAGDRVPWW